MPPLSSERDCLYASQWQCHDAIEVEQLIENEAKTEAVSKHTKVIKKEQNNATLSVRLPQLFICVGR